MSLKHVLKKLINGWQCDVFLLQIVVHFPPYLCWLYSDSLSNRCLRWSLFSLNNIGAHWFFLVSLWLIFPCSLFIQFISNFRIILEIKAYKSRKIELDISMTKIQFIIFFTVLRNSSDMFTAVLYILMKTGLQTHTLCQKNTC